MGLLLSDDVYYAQTAEGMTILSPVGPVTLIGRTPYPMLRALHPLLDGTYTLDELTAGLSEDRAAAVRRLVTMLSDTGVVRSTTVDDDIDTVGKALVIGNADFCTEMERTVRRSGGSVTRIVTDGGAEVTDAVRTALADTDFGYCWMPSLDPASVEAIETAFRGRGVPLAWVSSVGAAIWFAHGARTEDTPLSALSVLLRLDANGHVTEQNRAELAVPANTALAVRLERGRSSPRREAVRFDPDTLESSVVKTADHPFAAPAAIRSADEFGARIAELARSPRLTEAEFSTRAAGFRGEWTGLFTDPDESDFAQLPLRVCRATVSDPVGLLRLRGEPRPEVVGWGGDFALARYRAVEQALATYASIMVDPARLQTNSAHDVDAAGRAATLRALLAGAVRGRVHGYRLDDAAILMVEATTAFPVLDAATMPYRLPPGVAFGYSWDDAVCRGILGHCRETALRGLRTGGSAATRVRPPRGSAAESAALARLFGAELELWQVRSVPVVPAAACTIGGRLVSCTSGLTFDEAATAALETALLRCQSMAEQRPEYAPRVPEGILVDGIAAGAREADPIDLAGLTSIWTGAGRRPVVVPLDHDPRLSAVLPYLVHVVWAGERE